MTTAAPAASRRSLLNYAIGLDLIVIAVGVGLLLPVQPIALMTTFLAAVSLAAWRGGWRVGLATMVLAIASLVIVFSEDISLPYIILFALSGTGAAVFLGGRGMQMKRQAARPPAGKPVQRTLAEDRVQARIAEQASNRLRARALPWVMYLGLPLIVLVVFTNISDVLIRNFSIPSILQPLILVLAIPVLRYRDAFRPESAILQPLTLGLIAYCLFVFASSNWARDTALADSSLVDLLKSLGIFIVVASLAATWRALRLALVALVGGAVLLSTLALVQTALDDPSLEFGGLAALEIAHLYGETENIRPGGPVGDPNYFARILLVAFPAAAFLGLGRRSRAERAGWTAAALLIALAVLFTYSRGGMLALAVVMLLLLIVRRVRLTWATILLGGALLAALMLTPVGQRLLTMAALFGANPADAALDTSTDKRRHLLAAGWQMFTDHPIVGVGAGNFGSHYPEYANVVGFSGLDYTLPGVRQYAHSLYLETVAETGLLGLLLFLGAMTAALAMLYQSRRTLLERGEQAHAALVTAIGISLAGYLVSSIFLHSGYQRYMWLMLGLAAAAVRLTGSVRDAERAGS